MCIQFDCVRFMDTPSSILHWRIAFLFLSFARSSFACVSSSERANTFWTFYLPFCTWAMMMMSNKIVCSDVRACLAMCVSQAHLRIALWQMCELHFQHHHPFSPPLAFYKCTTNFIAIITFCSFASTIPNVIAFHLPCDDVDSWHEHRLHGSFFIISSRFRPVSFVVTMRFDRLLQMNCHWYANEPPNEWK